MLLVPVGIVFLFLFLIFFAVVLDRGQCRVKTIKRIELVVSWRCRTIFDQSPSWTLCGAVPYTRDKFGGTSLVSGLYHMQGLDQCVVLWGRGGRTKTFINSVSTVTTDQSPDDSGS